MKRWFLSISLASLAGACFLVLAAMAASPLAEIKNLRVVESGGRLKLVADTSQPVKPVLEKSAAKLILRVPASHLASVETLSVERNGVIRVRPGRHGDASWIVVDLSRSLPGASLVRAPGRFTLDLGPAETRAETREIDRTPRPDAAAQADTGKEQAGDSLVYRVVDVTVEEGDERSQVIISTDGPAKFKPLRLDGGKKISIKLLSSSLAWNSASAKTLAKGIEKVEARQSSAGGEPGVQVDVYLKEPLAYAVNRDQNQVILTIDHPVEQGEAARKGALDKRVSLDIQNGDLIGTLTTIAQQAGFQTYFTPSMLALAPPTSLVTLHVKDQPLSRILSNLLAVPGLLYDRQGNTLYFGSVGEIVAQKKLLPHEVLYYTPKRWERDVFVAKLLAEAQAVDPILYAGDRAGVQNDPDPSSQAVLFSATPDDMVKIMELVRKIDVPVAGDEEDTTSRKTQVFRLRYVDPMQLIDTVTQVMTPPGANIDGNIKTDARTRSFIITSSTKTLRKVQDLLDRLDIQLPQVSIEAQIVEVDADDARQLGILWSADASAGANPAIGGFVNAPVGVVGALNVATVQNGTSIRAQIQALATKSRANILSSPKIMAQDNQAATIQTQDTIYYQNTVSSVGPNGQPLINTTFVPLNVPITLAVTPQINEENNDIRMTVNFTVSSAPPQVGNAPPAVSQQTATTNVKVRDGETAVIGGLIRNRTTDVTSKVPVLGDIPLLGLLFRSHTVSTSKKELIILLTPTIARD